jgi:gamma-glutamyl-gamma-aminobutyrate hydrolase PuuD
MGNWNTWGSIFEPTKKHTNKRPQQSNKQNTALRQPRFSKVVSLVRVLQRYQDAFRSFHHPVRRETDSLIVRVTRVQPDETLQTNSFHHQAVHPEKIGRYLRATAWSSDEVIEAIEPSLHSTWARTGRFVLGVQWHPEQMQDETPHRNIFLALTEAAQRK